MQVLALLLYLKENWDEMPLWVIPLCLLLNVFLFWLILKRLVLKTFVFLYAQKFVPNREFRIINAQYCNQFVEVVETARDITVQ